MDKKNKQALRLILCAALGLAAAWLAFRYLLPLLLALVSAAALERPVELLSRRIPRALASGLCVMAVVLAVLALVWLASGKAAEAVGALLQSLTGSLGSVSGAVERLGGSLGSAAGHPWVRQALSSAEEYLDALPGVISEKALEAVPKLAEKAPEALLFAVTGVMGAYFFSASWPALRRFLFAQLSPEHALRLRKDLSELKRSFGGWLKAQALMELMVFALLAPAFLLLRVGYPLLAALAVALVDALPVLGAGTVLLPWAGFEFLSGRAGLGVGLLITYVAVAVLRSGAEAKLLGDQLGIHPLLSLAAVYLGWRVMGVGGMIVFPILAVSVKKLNDSGVVRLWKDTI